MLMKRRQQQGITACAVENDVKGRIEKRSAGMPKQVVWS